MKTIKFFAATGLTLGAVCVFLGCHSLRRGEPLVGPMKISDAKIARGQEVFMQQCHQCHPHGEGGLGPAMNQSPAPRFVVKTQIRAGVGAMPSFTKAEISPEDLEALADYVLALRRHDPISRDRF